MQKPVPAPQAPQTPQAPQASLLTLPASAIPQTAAEVRATRIKIEEMRTTLQDFAERRNSVAGQLRRADIDARPGYQARLANLDANINELQNQIAQATLALSNAPAGALVGGTFEGTATPIRGMPPEAVKVVGFFAGMVFLTLAIGVVGLIWRRQRFSASRAIPDGETSNQLRQLQQSVDSIAIEVERISEGQRFVTKALATREPEKLGR